MSLFIGEHYYKSFCVLVQIHIFSHILSGLLHGLSRKGAAGIHIHFSSKSSAGQVFQKTCLPWQNFGCAVKSEELWVKKGDRMATC